MRRADLSVAKLGGANFSTANFFRTYLSQISGSKTILSDAFILESNFSSAGWTNPIFRGARIISSEFTNASLQGADLSDTNFRTDKDELAAQSQKCGLTQAQLDQARCEPSQPPVLNGLLDSKTLQPLVWRGGPLDEQP